MTTHPASPQFLPALQRSATSAFLPIQREFNRLFDQLSTGWNAFTELDMIPRIDVRDTKKAIEVTVELPGIAQEDVKIDIDDNLLTISGEKKSEKESREEDLRVSERSYGAFSRTISLPRRVDADKIKATLSNGSKSSRRRKPHPPEADWMSAPGIWPGALTSPSPDDPEVLQTPTVAEERVPVSRCQGGGSFRPSAA